MRSYGLSAKRSVRQGRRQGKFPCGCANEKRGRCAAAPNKTPCASRSQKWAAKARPLQGKYQPTSSSRFLGEPKSKRSASVGYGKNGPPGTPTIGAPQGEEAEVVLQLGDSRKKISTSKMPNKTCIRFDSFRIDSFGELSNHIDSIRFVHLSNSILFVQFGPRLDPACARLDRFDSIQFVISDSDAFDSIRNLVLLFTSTMSCGNEQIIVC